MWDSVSKIRGSNSETKEFLRWLEVDVLTDDRLKKAGQLLAQAEVIAPEIKDLEQTPQGAPWHCEGIAVRSHLERMLAGLLALLDGQTLLSIEELAREKHLRNEILELETTIRENAATLQAFILLHDLSKSSVLSFDAHPQSPGASEGFVQHKHRQSELASQSERTLYFKLFRALATRFSNLSSGELVAKFFSDYGIQTHYFGHARVSAGSKYHASRLAIETWLKLEPRDAEILAFAIGNHIDVLDFFGAGPNVDKFELLVARANKANLDSDDALDILLAASFLDSALGSLAYQDGHFFVDLKAILNFLRSEELAAPARRAKRQEEIRLRQKKAFKDLLKLAGLSSEEIFKILNVPFGRGRKEVIESISLLVQDPSLPLPASLNNHEFKKRLTKARNLFDAQRITWENGLL